MNISLELRSVNTRLRIAYIVDAVNGGFPNCPTGNTFTRFVAEHHNDGIYDVFRNDHPYSNMWRTISNYYNAKRWYELSDMELTELWNSIRAVGIDNGDTHVPGVAVMDAKRRWDDNKWTRYECKRNGRRSVAYKIVPIGVLSILGISMPTTDVSI